MLIQRFDNTIQLTGITETTPDNFAVLVTEPNTLGPRPVQNFSQMSSLWNVSFGCCDESERRVNNLSFAPKASRIGGPYTDLVLLSGLTTVTDYKGETKILASSSLAGEIYHLDTKTGVASVYFNHSTMVPGINGIRGDLDTVRYTNAVKGI
jgi:hypothetical protein